MHQGAADRPIDVYPARAAAATLAPAVARPLPPADARVPPLVRAVFCQLVGGAHAVRAVSGGTHGEAVATQDQAPEGCRQNIIVCLMGGGAETGGRCVACLLRELVVGGGGGLAAGSQTHVECRKRR
jgi:hypothetical protein